MDNQHLVTKNLICKVLEGSRAYGTALPTSDTDIRGIFCADPINLLTPFFPVKEVEDASEEDTKFFELNHFMKLLLEQNPNIVQILWVRKKDVLETSPAYEYLRRNRKRFLSSKIAFTTSGYAHAQLKRIKGHNRWISNPMPVEKPQMWTFSSLVQWLESSKVLPSSFSLMDFNEDHMAVSYGDDIFGLYFALGKQLIRQDGSLNCNFEGDRESLGPPRAVFKINKANYREQCDKHSNYWRWKNNRNEARSELEEHHGFDTKHASHLVRLLRMGHEALTTGEINVWRSDAQELLAIRNGSMTYEEVIKYADSMDAEIKKAYDSTRLRKKADVKFAAKAIMHAQQLVWES